MVRNHNLAKMVNDAFFNKICELLKWKTKIKEKQYYQVDAYYPSSKTCSRCGKKTEVTNNLNIRNWVCEKCGEEHDRDINIMFEAHQDLLINK